MVPQRILLEPVGDWELFPIIISVPFGLLSP